MISLKEGEALNDYSDSIEQWRIKREVALMANDGWLSVAGLHWLDQGENTVDLLAFYRDGDTVTHAGKVLRPDVDKISVGGKTLFVIVRGPKVGLRVLDQQSPFRRDFKGLKWYPVKPEYCVDGTFISYAEPRKVSMATVIDVEEEYTSPGVVAFELHGQACQLEVLQAGPKRLFIVMRDQTSGKSTYGASRFLYADAAMDGKVLLDFNKAYSPPCAFTPFATCPLPPMQNWLPVAVEAGELY